MKYIKIFSFLLLLGSISSCDLDLVNPNAATEEQALKTKDGLFAVAVGTSSLYAGSALGAAINSPSITARESSAMTTFSSLEELQDGGPQLSGENERITRLFSRAMRVKGMAESIIDNVDDVDLEAGTKSGLVAVASMYKALCLGDLANNWTDVAINNGTPSEPASYSSRMDAYNEALSLVTNAIGMINSNPISDEFVDAFGSNIDILNTLHALASRFSLFSGDNDGAIAHAQHAIDGFSTASNFSFDGQNKNPVFLGYFDGTVQYAPVVNFGLPASFVIDTNDQRISFFITETGESSLIGLPVGALAAPFFTTESSAIPVFRFGEMLLNQAEAYARKDMPMEAENALNTLLKKSDDPSGINAGLAGDFTASGDMNKLLDEIYKNRRIELFLSGMSLEDSRRFNRPEPPTSIDINSERNRNFYPFPADERLNNTNTPGDPSI